MVSISTSSNLPGDSSIPPVPRLSDRLLIARQTFHRNDLAEPLLGRLGEMTAPAPIRWNIVLDGTHGRDLSPIADLEMVVDADLCTQRHIVTYRQAAREPDLGRQQAMPANGHIVTDLDL